VAACARYDMLNVATAVLAPAQKLAGRRGDQALVEQIDELAPDNAALLYGFLAHLYPDSVGTRITPLPIGATRILPSA
jgi:hypothetical protein